MEFTNCGHARIRGLLFRYAAQVNYYQKVKTEGKVVKDKEEEDSLTSSKQIATTMMSAAPPHAVCLSGPYINDGFKNTSSDRPYTRH